MVLPASLDGAGALCWTWNGDGTVNALAQAAALAGLEDDRTVSWNVSQLVAERNRVAIELAKSGVMSLPSQANFLLARSPGKADAETTDALVEYLFDKTGILINRTREAGLENFFRFSLSIPEHNDRLIESIAEFSRW